MALLNGMFGNRKPKFGAPEVFNTPGIGDGWKQPTFAPGMIGSEPAPQAERPGFFSEGGAGRAIAGTIGDALLQSSGMAPIYAPQQRQNQMLQFRAQQEQMDRQSMWRDWLAKEQWKRDNPQAPQPTEFERQLAASGLPAGEQQQIIQQYVRTRAAGDPIVQSNADGTKTIYPRQMLFGGGQAQPAAPSTPAVGTIEDGYRFKGGNPADPNSWEQVGGAGSGQRNFP